MSDRFRRLTNALILLGAIVVGTKAVESQSLFMGAIAFLLAFSYTFFIEDNKKEK